MEHTDDWSVPLRGGALAPFRSSETGALGSGLLSNCCFAFLLVFLIPFTSRHGGWPYHGEQHLNKRGLSLSVDFWASIWWVFFFEEFLSWIDGPKVVIWCYSVDSLPWWSSTTGLVLYERRGPSHETQDRSILYKL